MRTGKLKNSNSMNLIIYKPMCVEFETTNGKKIIENVSFQKQVFLCITLGRSHIDKVNTARKTSLV